MDSKTLIVTILTSSFAAAIITSLASGVFSLRLKKREFIYEYHKKILEKRLAAYELIETLVSILKASVVDTEDGKTYHLIFAFDYETLVKQTISAHLCMSQGMWLSEEITKELNNFNYIYLNAEANENDLIAFGKKHHSELSKIRHRIEKSFSKDINNLHDIKGFLSQKKNQTDAYNFVEIQKG